MTGRRFRGAMQKRLLRNFSQLRKKLNPMAKTASIELTKKY